MEAAPCYEQPREHLSIYMAIDIEIEMKFDRLLGKMQTD